MPNMYMNYAYYIAKTLIIQEMLVLEENDRYYTNNNGNLNLFAFHVHMVDSIR